MVRIEWQDRHLSIEIETGERLLDAIDERPYLGTFFGCRGATCGTCRVQVVQGGDLLRAAESDERDTLRSLQARDDERLACQIRIAASEGLVQLNSARAKTNA